MRVALRFEIGPSWLVLDIASGVGLDALDFDALGVPRADFSSAGALFVAERPSAARLHVQLDALGPAGGADGSLVLSGSVAEQPKHEAPLSTLLTFGTSFALYPDALIESETALVLDDARSPMADCSGQPHVECWHTVDDACTYQWCHKGPSVCADKCPPVVCCDCTTKKCWPSDGLDCDAPHLRWCVLEPDADCFATCG